MMITVKRSSIVLMRYVLYVQTMGYTVLAPAGTGERSGARPVINSSNVSLLLDARGAKSIVDASSAGHSDPSSELAMRRC